MPYTFSSVYSAGWSRDRLSSSFSTAARTPAAAAVDASGTVQSHARLHGDVGSSSEVLMSMAIG